MNEPSRQLMRAIAEFQQDIVLLDGKCWSRSHCELHYQYKEWVIWLETHSLKQTQQCPRHLLKLYDNYSSIISEITISTWIYLNSTSCWHIYPLDKTQDLLAIGKGERVFDESDYFKQSFNNNSPFKQAADKALLRRRAL